MLCLEGCSSAAIVLTSKQGGPPPPPGFAACAAFTEKGHTRSAGLFDRAEKEYQQQQRIWLGLELQEIKLSNALIQGYLYKAKHMIWYAVGTLNHKHTPKHQTECG